MMHWLKYRVNFTKYMHLYHPYVYIFIIFKDFLMHYDLFFTTIAYLSKISVIQCLI